MSMRLKECRNTGANPTKLFKGVIYEPTQVKHLMTRLKRLARDKHSSLLRKFVNIGHKKIYKDWPQNRFKNSPH